VPTCASESLLPGAAGPHASAPLLALLEVTFPWVDPVALDLPGPVDVRWYGLMYLAGFACAYVILRRMSRSGHLRLPPQAVGDLLGVIAIGVIVGGRIGYVLFYDLSDVLADPRRVLRTWEGGMSFHGGLLGVIAAAAWFARRRRVPFLNLSDALALAIPFGIFAVRLANFINGELYGRIAGPDVPWAMRFPTDPIALRLLGAEGLPLRAREARIDAAYESRVWDAVRDQVPLRHPSQLYEALGEGIILGAFLWAVFWWLGRRDRHAAPGVYAALFLVGYGVARFVVEFFRQPDVQFRGPGDPLGTVLGPLTMGQTLSSLMLLTGVGILARAWRRSRGASGE
jgi:phosphatidylglycerol:prolipoprotein diacylglycerol transferase